MKLSKKENRLRRARRGRAKIRELKATRLSVHRTPQHIYAQVIGSEDNKILASASTLEAEVRKGIKSCGNVEAAAIVGARIAEKAKAAGIDTVAFDRSGFRYHGRVKALADAAREAGLKF
jgi:large subunit ribosomal protein L18